MSLEPFKEKILLDNLDVIDIEQLEDEINHIRQSYNIYRDKKINLIKMSKTNIINDSHSNKNSTDTKIEDREQIHEVKYNIFFIIHNKCKFDENIYDEIIKDRNIIAKRLVIIDNSQNNGQKQYIFVPKGKEPCFEYKNKKINIKDKVMFFDDMPLINDKEFKRQKKQNKVLFNDNESSISSKSNDYISVNNNSINSGSKKSKKSKKDDSSENESIKADIINYYIESGKYIKFLYVENFEKEVDGIYPFHEKIQLIKGTINLNKEYILNDNNYNVQNDLNAFIIFKNFEAYSIPKDTPVIIEVKKSFDLLGLLKQIKKISKIAKNMTGTKTKIPQFVIGIMCSFGEESVEQQFNKINEKKLNSESTLFQSINKTIEDNGIKYALAVIKEEKIGDYNLGIEDYSLDNQYKRVDISLMNQKLKFGLTSEQTKEMQKIIKYESINYEKKLEISFLEYDRIKKEKSEAEKKAKELEEKNTKELEEKNKQIQEKNKQIQEKNKQIQEQNQELIQLRDTIKQLREQNHNLFQQVEQYSQNNKQ